MSKWDINYDGWVTVEANTELEALELVNKMLSDSGIVNDGKAGEWYVLNAEEEELTDAV